MHRNMQNALRIDHLPKLQAAWTITSLLLFLVTVSTTALGYPTKPIRFIVPNVPGGSGDVIARALSEKLQQRFGQSFIIDNRSGAGTIIGTQIAAKAPADGYTIILSALPHVINPHLQQSVGYDPIKDFSPITLVGYTPMYLFASLGSKITTVNNLISLAKASPGKLAVGSGGNGTATHLATELLKARAGVSMIHTPYKGTGPALLDLAGGHLPFVFSSLAAATPLVKAGKITAVAVANDRRGQASPEIPTFAEAGLKDLVVVHWLGVLAPAGVNPKIVNLLNSEFVSAINAPDIRERFGRLDIEPSPTSPEKFKRFLTDESLRWGDVLKKANLIVN